MKVLEKHHQDAKLKNNKIYFINKYYLSKGKICEINLNYYKNNYMIYNTTIIIII